MHALYSSLSGRFATEADPTQAESGFAKVEQVSLSREPLLHIKY